jgi:hypothetical protein
MLSNKPLGDMSHPNIIMENALVLYMQIDVTI